MMMAGPVLVNPWDIFIAEVPMVSKIMANSKKVQLIFQFIAYTLPAFRKKSRPFYCLEETALKLVSIGMILYCWMFKQNNESPASLPSLRFLDRASENWSTNLRQMLPEHRTLPQFT
jgi:hypothetical protein